MSDARNSSNALRGGGAKQTGGSGRTQKNAFGNQKTDLLGDRGLRASQERSDARRKLQLQVTSRQLAADLRAALLADHTAEEYAEYQIPLPDEEDAKAKLKAMKEFTEKWYDKEFRDEWLRTVHELWLEEITTKYEAAVRAAKEEKEGRKGKPPEEGEAASIEELTERLAALGPEAAEERQRLKKKIKKKKQRAREKEKGKDPK